MIQKKLLEILIEGVYYVIVKSAQQTFDHIKSEQQKANSEKKR